MPLVLHLLVARTLRIGGLEEQRRKPPSNAIPKEAPYS